MNDPTPPYAAIALGIVALAAIAALIFTFFTVEQRTVAIVQRLGKFVREAGPGLNLKIPFIDSVAGRVNLRVQQLDVKIETKTEDNVFVHMVVAVQFYVLQEKVYDAFYKLDDARKQITSYVFDVVRAQVPKIKLDDVFEKKDDIAGKCKVRERWGLRCTRSQPPAAWELQCLSLFSLSRVRGQETRAQLGLTLDVRRHIQSGLQ